MKRREFIKSAVVAASAAGAAPLLSGCNTLTGSSAHTPSQGSQYYELRTYAFKTQDQFNLIDSFWAKAGVPALNRLGIMSVGVFTDLDKDTPNRIFVLIPYPSLEVLASVPAGLAADSAYHQAGAEYLDAPKSAPAYDRIESSLFIAFDGMKQLEVPDSPSSGRSRVFELRTYQSRSEARALNKVVMFNSGEIPLMHEVNLGPVFFGQALVGSGLPQLTYMVSSESKETHAEHWKAFFAAPNWKKLSGDPQYKDNVSKVISVFLRRTTASQI